ncbi:MAG: T9SS type A sorting domain-containing protein [Saprospiraceae bacterium]
MKPILVLAILFFGFCLHAQKITPSVIASAGAVMKSNNVSLEWTMGEVITETRSSGNLIVTQGFHQANLGVPSSTYQSSIEGLQVYPNPVRDILNINNDSGEALQMQLFGSNGELLMSSPLQKGYQELKLQSYIPGMYHLIIQKGSASQNFTLEKINN